MSKAVYKRRLLKASDIVEKVPPRLFYMGSINIYECGAPACVLGHYFIRHPKPLREANGYLFFAAKRHFGVNDDEAFELFSSSGCGNAKTGK